MRFNTILLSLSLLFPPKFASGQFVKREESKVILDNGHVKRDIILDGQIYTEGLFLNGSQKNYVGVDYTLFDITETGQKETTQNTGIQRPKSREFSVVINDRTYTGERGWKVKEVRHIKDDHQGEGILLILESIEEEIRGVELGITYML